MEVDPSTSIIIGYYLPHICLQKLLNARNFYYAVMTFVPLDETEVWSNPAMISHLLCCKTSISAGLSLSSESNVALIKLQTCNKTVAFWVNWSAVHPYNYKGPMKYTQLQQVLWVTSLNDNPEVGFTFQSLNKTLVCHQWYESYWSEAAYGKVLYNITVMLYKVTQTRDSADETPVCRKRSSSLNLPFEPLNVNGY